MLLASMVLLLLPIFRPRSVRRMQPVAFAGQDSVLFVCLFVCDSPLFHHYYHLIFLFTPFLQNMHRNLGKATKSFQGLRLRLRRRLSGIPISFNTKAQQALMASINNFTYYSFLFFIF